MTRSAMFVLEPRVHRKSVTCRGLFGSVDRIQLQRDLASVWSDLVEQCCSRWNFDFRYLCPSSGGYYEWISMAKELGREDTKTRTQTERPSARTFVPRVTVGGELDCSVREENCLEIHRKNQTVPVTTNGLSVPNIDAAHKKKHLQKRNLPVPVTCLSRDREDATFLPIDRCFFSHTSNTSSSSEPPNKHHSGISESGNSSETVPTRLCSAASEDKSAVSGFTSVSKSSSSSTLTLRGPYQTQSTLRSSKATTSALHILNPFHQRKRKHITGSEGDSETKEKKRV